MWPYIECPSMGTRSVPILWQYDIRCVKRLRAALGIKIVCRQRFAQADSASPNFATTSRASCKVSFGVNYGKIANNLPAPVEVISLLHSIPLNKARLYDTDSLVLRTFRNTNISFLVGVANEDLASLASLEVATRWVKSNILPYYPATDITGIVVGNEIFGGTDTTQLAFVLPAMRNIYSVLVTLGLQNKIRVSTSHSFAVLVSSYPPSSGAFDPIIANRFMKPMLQFLELTNAPFMINAYPFFTYKDNPGQISLHYVLFEDKVGIRDVNTGVMYYNMFDAQLDAVYSAMAALGYPNVTLMVSETGWPSAGDANEAGANVSNAQAYQRNLVKHLSSAQGTPLKPDSSMEVYYFALFNENLKPGPKSEQHYGLFKPDKSKVYNFSFLQPSSSTAWRKVTWAMQFAVWLTAFLVQMNRS